MPNCPKKHHPLLVVTELLLPTKGGTAVWFDKVYRHIGGKDIHIITASVPGDEDHDRTHPNSVHRIRLERHWWLRPESLVIYLKFLFKGLQVWLTQPIMAVHAGRVLPEGFVGWLISRIARKPLLVYAHGEEITTWRQPAKFRLMRFTYRHAEHIIANSDFTRDELLKIGVDVKRISLISPGVDLDLFRPGLPTDDLFASIGLCQRSRLILSVGRLSRRKGFDQVLRAVSQLRSEGFDVEFAQIGIGGDEDYLRELAMELGIASQVHFLGHVSTADLPRWYNACTFFAMPNRKINQDVEGFGMVFLEAAACHKASIAGRSGGTGTAVIDGKTGLRVDGESVSEITDAMKRLLTDSQLLETLSANAYERAVREYSWSSVAQKTVSLSNDEPSCR